MPRILIIAITCCWMMACHDSPRPDVNNDGREIKEIPADSAAIKQENEKHALNEFKDFYTEFFKTFLDANERKFNTYIYPEYGLSVISSSGALPLVTAVKDIADFKLGNGNSIFSIDKGTIGFEVIEESLPELDCDLQEHYTKTGCFTEEINQLKDSGIWEHVNLKPGEKEKIREAAASIVKTVVNTSNYTYYFSYIGDNWYLTFLDTRVPCEA